MARQALITLLTVVAFGILVPWYKGFAFLDPRMVAAYGLIAVLFVAPASAESFAGIPDMSTSSILSRLGVLIGLGWGVTVIVLLTGLVTLNVAYGHGVFIKPPWELFGSVLACSLMASAAVAAASAVLARSRSPIVVKTVLRLVFLAVLLAFVFASRLPDAWQIALAEHTTRRAITRLAWEGAGIGALAAALLLIPLLHRPVRASSV